MRYYFLVSLPFLLVLTRTALTNFIVPYYKKKSLYQQIKIRPDWPMIAQTEHKIEQLFSHVYGKAISITYRSIHFNRNKEFIYGEVDILAFYLLLEKTQPRPGDIFYDLGSGSGKAVFTAAFYFDFSKACGIELLAPLFCSAQNRLQQANQLLKPEHSTALASIQFIQDNFLNYNFQDANIIYIAATCLHESTWEKLINKLATLSPGTRIIVATKTIQNDKFTQTYQGVELMSWGLCPVTIYQITES